MNECIIVQNLNPQLNKLLSYVWNYSEYEEKWKEVPDTSLRYFVSNHSRVLSLCNDEPLILTPFLQGSSTKYYYVSIRKDYEQKAKDRAIHLLVAEAFIEKPLTTEKLHCHHIDNNSLNNNYENLKWITAKEHLKYHAKKRRKKSN